MELRETFFLLHHVPFFPAVGELPVRSSTHCTLSIWWIIFYPSLCVCSSTLQQQIPQESPSYVKMIFHVEAAVVCLVKASRKAGRTDALLSVFDSKALDSSIVQSTVTNIGGSRHWVFTEHCKMHREILWPYWLYFKCLGGEPEAPCLLSAVQSCTIVVLL